MERDATGTARLVGRRTGVVHGVVAECPDGRRKHRVLLPPEHHGGFECAHDRAIDRGHLVEAAHWLYLVPSPEGGMFVVECTYDEARWIAARGLSAAEVRTYLGVENARAA